MRFARFALAVTIMASLPLSQPAAQTLRQVALVIGNANYKAITPLRNPEHDAQLVAGRLQNLQWTLVGGGAQLNLSRSKFKEAVQQFAIAAKEADVTLFYYAGHGVQISDKNYLIPIDADPDTEDDVPAQSVSGDSVLAAVRSLNTKLNVMIFDACRDNPFLNRVLFSQSRSIGSPDTGLAEMRAPGASMIWYATEPGKKAKDGTGNNSPYAMAIGKYIGIPSMDIYRFFNQSGQDVFNVTTKYQQPWLASSPVSGLYYFADSSGRAVFVPYEVANVDRGISKNSAESRITALFSQGVSVPSRDFKFGQTYGTINSLLDSSFSIKSWEVLPIAGEFKSDEVRYFWVWLNALPVVQSAIANLEDGKPKCIDPQSYIVFFFKNQRYFRTSMRFYKGGQCSDYSWIRSLLFGAVNSAATLEGPSGSVEAWFKDHTDYTVLEVIQRGVAKEPENIYR